MNLKQISRGPLAGKYAVSDCGQIVNCLTGRVLKPDQTTTNRGKRQTYYRVNLFANNRGYKFAVHRLVAMAFLPNPDKKPEVNHIDGNRHNNHVSNLEWVTRKENSLHSTQILKKNIGSAVKSSKLKEEDVKEIVKLLEDTPIKEIASVYKVTYDCIWRISKGFNWSHVTNIRKEAINASSH